MTLRALARRTIHRWQSWRASRRLSRRIDPARRALISEIARASRQHRPTKAIRMQLRDLTNEQLRAR